METIIFNSTNELTESIETSLAFSNISSFILNPKTNTIGLVGAGISTELGIRDFRSSDGLYSSTSASSSSSSTTASSSTGLKVSTSLSTIKSLFDSSVYLTTESRAAHWKFISDLHSQIELVTKSTSSTKRKTSSTLKFFKRLEKKSKLRRLYSQNIDGYEGNANLSYVSLREQIMEDKVEKPIVSGRKRRVYDGNVVALHGSIQQVRCSNHNCNWIDVYNEVYHESFQTAKPLVCPECFQKVEERVEQGKRYIQTRSFVRPNIVLYNESTNTEEVIASIARSDLASSPNLLLVLGTSLKIPGFKLLVKNFAQVVRKNGGISILVNLEEVSNEWYEVFDYHIQGKCEDVVKRFTKDWKASTPSRVKKIKKRKLSNIISEPITTFESTTLQPQLTSPSTSPSTKPLTRTPTSSSIASTSILTPSNKLNSPSPSKKIKLLDQQSTSLLSSDVSSNSPITPTSKEKLSISNSITTTTPQRDLIEVLLEALKENGDHTFRYSEVGELNQVELKGNDALVRLIESEWKNEKKERKEKRKQEKVVKVTS